MSFFAQILFATRFVWWDWGELWVRKDKFVWDRWHCVPPNEPYYVLLLIVEPRLHYFYSAYLVMMISPHFITTTRYLAITTLRWLRSKNWDGVFLRQSAAKKLKREPLWVFFANCILWETLCDIKGRVVVRTYQHLCKKNTVKQQPYHVLCHLCWRQSTLRGRPAVLPDHILILYEATTTR